jgi:hypothetical protein
MHAHRLHAVPAAITLLAALLLPVAPAGGAAPVAAAAPESERRGCDPLPGPDPDVPPRVLSRLAPNFANEHLEVPGPYAIRVCARVDELGLVSEARLLEGGTPFDSAAVDAVRWWLFEPARHGGKPVPGALAVTVEVAPPPDGEPLVPDVLALARAAEARGDHRGAIDAWTGVLARVGSHPTLSDEWSVREHVLRLAARLPAAPTVPRSLDGRARGARNLMQRNIARGANADYARTLDTVLLGAPWYVDAYRWRAAARAASGDRAGALRDARCYALAAPDSAGRALVRQALRALAAGDTLAANSMLKH